MGCDIELKKFLPILLALILTVLIFTGCRSINNPECGLFYGDSLELYVGQKVYSCEGTWFCLDSIVSDTRGVSDSTEELVVALTYKIYNEEYHAEFSTFTTAYNGIDFSGYRFMLIDSRLENPGVSDHYLDVYDIYPPHAINNTMLNNGYRISCIFKRDIEG